MPVIGTPGVTPGGSATLPGEIEPRQTKQFGIAVPGRMRNVSLAHSQCPTIRLQMLTTDGDPIDLTPVAASPYTPAFAFREQMSRDPGCSLFEVASIESPVSDGFISGPVPQKIAISAGIYVLEMVITDDTLYPRASSDGEVVTASGKLNDSTYRITTVTTGSAVVNYDYPLGVKPAVGLNAVVSLGQQLVQDVCVVLSNVLYLTVDRGLHGVSEPGSEGPPTIAEVRLHLRDYPETNLLLDDYEFDEAEIAASVTRCIDFFNECQPQVIKRFDTRNFPFRWHWLEGIASNLFRTAAHWHRRNRLPYSAGGLTVDDTGKEKEYLAAAEMHGQTWKDFVKKQKVRLNMEEGFGSVGSDYRYGGRGYW